MMAGDVHIKIKFVMFLYLTISLTCVEENVCVHKNGHYIANSHLSKLKSNTEIR